MPFVGASLYPGPDHGIGQPTSPRQEGRPMIHGETITRATRGFSDIHDLTDDVRAVIRRAGVDAGLVTVSAVGSTASVTTLEFEPALVRDMEEALEALWSRTMASHHSQTWG